MSDPVGVGTVINLCSIKGSNLSSRAIHGKGEGHGSDPAVSFLTKGVLRLFHVGIVVWQKNPGGVKQVICMD